MSTLFTKTLRQDPADAEFPSHKLLVRGGYIRRAAPGVYTWLPLGLAVVAKIEAIVRDEMNAIGAQEVRFPVLLPSEPYKATNRWVEYGDNLFRLQDRRENDMLLGPTHEEMFTLLVKDMCTSYKDLPLNLYQIQTKFRDEARPRAGLIRGREFIMKDAYTFDMDEAGLKAQYADIRVAYQRIFDRLGFRYVIVAADAGAMGGSKSEEFQAISPNGEDTFVYSDGGYAANVEAVVTPAPPSIDYANAPAAHVEDTPDVPTIDTLVALSNELFPRADRPWTGADTLKNIAYWVKHLDGTRTPLIVGLPGDREIDEKRLEVALAPETAEPMIAEDFAAAKGIAGVLARGYIGPAKDGAQFLGEKAPSGVRYLLDPRVVPGTSWITGANEPGHHVYDLVAGRDFTSDGVIDVAEIREGDPAPDGSGPLKLSRGIEIGHIFQLGYKYADALDLKVLDANGKLVTVIMGSYGLGISRAVAAIAEDTYDEKGLCWPRNVAPYDVYIVAAGKDEAIFAAARELASQLDAAGVSVLLDDRPASPGVKFADAELLGMPTVVVVGRALQDGKVEIRDRKTGAAEMVEIKDAVDAITSVILR
ncbi:MAG: proline--tRNA ligase [Propionibacteriaceae bacterium]|nr:proline--tRNA ligase [Propionibacteriaceae bacterium]